MQVKTGHGSKELGYVWAVVTVKIGCIVTDDRNETRPEQYEEKLDDGQQSSGSDDAQLYWPTGNGYLGWEILRS